MRILIFSELFYPHGGGAEKATWLYSQLLAKEGFSVTIVTNKFPNELNHEVINDRVEVFRVPMKAMFGTRYCTLVNIGILTSNFVIKLIKRSDVIYIPGGWYSALPIAKYYKKPTVVHLHNYLITCPTSLMYDFVTGNTCPSSLKSFMLHEIIERRRRIDSVVLSLFMNKILGEHYSKLGLFADAIVFVSRAQMNLVLSSSPYIRDKSHLVYNPIPNVPLIKARKIGVGYFGGKSYVKGYYVLTRALKYLKKQKEVIEVYLTKTSSKHRSVALDNYVLLHLLNKLDNTRFLELMKKLTMVVVPSLWPEPLPYSLIESMLYGKLIIASKVGGIPEIIKSANVAVRLIEAGNYEQLA
ncbi:MAG: glycosyltransferase, partial [Nitrososphaeria archaeon]